MNENEMNQEVVEEVKTDLVTAGEEKNEGLSTGAKFGVFGLLAFAILGVWKLIELIIGGVKKVVGFFKGKKKEKPAEEPKITEPDHDLEESDEEAIKDSEKK